MPWKIDRAASAKLVQWQQARDSAGSLPYNNNMKPLLLILDDWEDLIQASSAWHQISQLVEIKFLQQHLDRTGDAEIEQAQFIMEVRERTTLDEPVFKRIPHLKLILQTGGHAYHIDRSAAQKQNIQIALGRQVKAPLHSVPELTFAFALGLIHKVNQGNSTMHKGQWQLFTGRTLANRRLGILGLGRHGLRVAQIASTAFDGSGCLGTGGES